MPKVDGLTDREEKFLVAYAATNNGRQSALEAGYSPKIASVMACRILKKPSAIAILNKIKRKDEKKYELTREKVLAELAKGLFRDIRSLFNPEGILVLNHSVINGKATGKTIHDLPIELTDSIVGVKQKVDCYTADDVEHIKVETEVKILPKDRAIDMAMKHLGAYAPIKTENDNVQRIDWDSMLQRPVIIDPVQEAAKQLKE